MEKKMNRLDSQDGIDRRLSNEFNINKYRKILTKNIETFVRLLFVSSGQYDELKKENKDFKLNDIKITLSAPGTLNMNNSNEMSNMDEYYRNFSEAFISLQNKEEY